MVEVGKVIQEHLEIKSMTQLELAKHVGLTQKAISKYVTGKSQPPLDILEKIINLLDISPSEIFTINSTDTKTFIKTKDEFDFISIYRELSTESKSALLETAHILKKVLK